MDREGQHPPAEFRDPARVVVQRAEIPEKQLRPLQRARLRRLEPAEGFQVVDATRFSVSTTSLKSSRFTSGTSCGARCWCSRSVQSRMHRPGAVRPRGRSVGRPTRG